jgi:hypothetical protein
MCNYNYFSNVILKKKYIGCIYVPDVHLPRALETGPREKGSCRIQNENWREPE